MWTAVFAFVLALAVPEVQGQCSDTDFTVAYGGQPYFTVSSLERACVCNSYQAQQASTFQGGITTSSLAVTGTSTFYGTIRSPITVANSNGSVTLAGPFVEADGSHLTNLLLQPDIASWKASVDTTTAGLRSQIDGLQRQVNQLRAQLAANASIIEESQQNQINRNCFSDSECKGFLRCSPTRLRCLLSESYACNMTAQCTDGFFCADGYCLGYPCPSFSVDNGTLVEGMDFRYPHNATVQCAPGFTVRGSPSRTCLINSTWNVAAPTCEANPCNVLPPPVNGAVVVSNNGSYPSTGRYSCNPGYYASAGTINPVCQTNGQWTGIPLVCSPVSCGVPPNVTGANVTYTLPVYGYTATYRCPGGTLPIGPQNITCQVNGNWSTGPTSCGCPVGQVPFNGNCITPRNCEEIKLASGTTVSGLYWIDPDGPNFGVGRQQVHCDMTSDGGGWASIFNVTLPFSTGGAACLIGIGNDDNDGYIMWSDLSARVATDNGDLTSGNYYQVTNAVYVGSSTLPNRPTTLTTTARPVVFPASNRVVWFDWAAGTPVVRWESYGQAINVPFSNLGISAMASNCFNSYGSNYFLINDGVDMVLVGCPAVRNVLLKFNFVQNAVSAVTPTSVFAPQSGNWLPTEEDQFGASLLTVNGRIFYYNTAGNMALGGSLLNPTGAFYQSRITWPLGTEAQTGIDLTGFVMTTSRQLALTDWGHDNGGFFNCGDDNYLGYAISNIVCTL